MAEHDVAQGEGESSYGERMYATAFRVRIAHPHPSAILIAVMADARKFMETVKAEEEAEQAGETEKQYVPLWTLLATGQPTGSPLGQA